MQIISLGTDKNILNQNSRSRARLLEYTQYFKKYYCVIFCDEVFDTLDVDDKLTIIKLDKKHIFISLDKLIYYLRGRGVRKNNTFISSQDPFEIGLIAYYLSWRLKLNLHVQIHTDIFSKYFIFENWRTMIQKIFSIFVIKKSKVIRVVSKSLRDNLIKKTNIKSENIFVAPILPDLTIIKKLEEEKPDGINKNFNILMISRFVKFKNLQNAIRAFAIFSKDKEVVLTIIGGGPLKSKLEEIIEKNNLKQKVTLKDWTENAIEYYAKSDLFLHTALYEGFGMVIYEALFYNLPIVTTPFGAALDFVGDSENIIQSKNFSATEIAKSLELGYAKFKNKKINTKQDLEKFDRDESIKNQIASWHKTFNN